MHLNFLYMSTVDIVKKELIFATDEDIVRKYKAELFVLNRIAGKQASEM